jgi:predicted phosphodiesterase
MPDGPGFEVNVPGDSVVFAQIGDFGDAGEAEKRVSDLVKSWNPDFIISAGDGNYSNGKYSTLRENIIQYYGDYIFNYDAPLAYRCNGKAFEEGMNRFFPTPGNHDVYGIAGLAPYFDFFTLPGNESNYKFTWGPVSFFSLNTVEGDLTEQRLWLENQLGISQSPFNIVFFHHSPYSSGSHGNHEALQWDYFSMGVDVILTGHDHLYENIEKKGEEGTYYLTNGLGGRALAACNVYPLPGDLFTAFCYGGDYGAVKATATNEKLILEFYSVGSPAEPIDRILITK